MNSGACFDVMATSYDGFGRTRLWDVFSARLSGGMRAVI